MDRWRMGHGGAGFPAHPDHPDGTVYRLVPRTASPGRADTVTALRRRRHHRSHLPSRYRPVLVLLCCPVQLLHCPAAAQHADHPGLACRYLPLWPVAARNDLYRSAASDHLRLHRADLQPVRLPLCLAYDVTTAQPAGIGQPGPADRSGEPPYPDAGDRNRPGPLCGLLLLDIDHFKIINDTHGHAEGDRVLVDLADLVWHSSRRADRLFRLGGEEFVLLLPGADLSGLNSAAQNIVRAVGERVHTPDGPVTVSIGGTLLLPEDEGSSWIHRADICLYQAKNGGRNRSVIHGAESQGTESGEIMSH